jgi:hypothetical protein
MEKISKSGNPLLTFLSCLFLAIALASCGGKDVEIENGNGSIGPFGGPSSQATETTFQIGDTWGAYQVTAQGLNNLNNFVYTQLATNMVKINTTFAAGSGFYIGKYQGEHLIATSAHVLDNVPSCSILPVIITFSLGQQKYNCKAVSTWKDIDFAIITLKKKTSEEDEEDSFLASLNPLQFDFNTKLRKGEPLFTGGHGTFNNPNYRLTINSDADCMIYSQTGETKKLTDPRQASVLNVPSFAVGCDISSGDSGGPAVSRSTGLVQGVIWSTKTPKPARFRSRTFLRDAWQTSNPEIWDHMAYAVSASDIRARLIRWTEAVKRSRPMRKRREMILSLLGLNF